MNIILKIIKAMPNPVGKDKANNLPKPEQLLGEWVDIKNVGTVAIKLSEISLSHTKFNNHCEMIGTDCYWIGGDSFSQPGQIVRVHTGKISDKYLMKQKDELSRDWSCFANRDNFVLNNYCGDTLTLTWRDSNGHPKTDTASYDKNQQEGAILVRIGNKLIVGVSRPV